MNDESNGHNHGLPENMNYEELEKRIEALERQVQELLKEKMTIADLIKSIETTNRVGSVVI